MSAMLVWLSLIVPAQAAPDAAAKTVESFVYENVAAVVRLDLAALDPKALAAQVAKLADAPEVNEAAAVVTRWVDAMKAAGVRELDVLLDISGLPGLPVVVVPLAEGADAGRIVQALKSNPPLAWPAAERVRGAVVGGMPEVVARLKAAPPAADRPAYSAARAAVADAPASVVLIPTDAMRRVLEETLPNLPPQVGGGPVTTLTRGLSWSALRADFGASPTLKLVAQATDPKAAEAVAAVAKRALAAARAGLGAMPEAKDLAAQLGQVQPVVQGDQVRLEADLGRMTALVGVPLHMSRGNARQSQCMNNLKQIALALHNHHSASNSFPPAYIASKDGKPLLSWRVAILPYIDQQALYNEFKLDEPWDSPHNKPLLARMPAVYHCPTSNTGEGLTTYLVPRGERTMFPGTQGVTVRDVTDGTSNTIMVVDAGDSKAVPWTKPEDWEVGEAPAPDALVGHHAGGFNTAFADGSAHFLRGTIDRQVFKALLSRNGGEVVGQRDF